ncbi:hypothetical protein SCUP234_04893 [Seiridium cupressi]
MVEQFEPQWNGTINEDFETGVSEFLLISDMVLAADLSSEDLDLHKSNPDNVDLDLHKSNPDNVDLDAVPEVLSLHTNHESTWVAIKQWLQRCQGRHTDCNDLRSHPAWLPTRLLDTGLGDKDCIRVVDTVNLAPDSVTYIALSHCWGKKHFLVMDEDSKDMFQTGPGVPVSALALNFQDAIHATRKLGLRYIWIDSFCILQGSREDWQLEAPMMNKVYRNAILTLAPTTSSDAYQMKKLVSSPLIVFQSPPSLPSGLQGWPPRIPFAASRKMLKSFLPYGGVVLTVRLLPDSSEMVQHVEAHKGQLNAVFNDLDADMGYLVEGICTNISGSENIFIAAAGIDSNLVTIGAKYMAIMDGKGIPAIDNFNVDMHPDWSQISILDVSSNGTTQFDEILWIDPAIWDMDQPQFTCSPSYNVRIPPWTDATSTVNYPLITVSHGTWTRIITQAPLTITEWV